MKSDTKLISQSGTLVVMVPKVNCPTTMLMIQQAAIGMNLDESSGNQGLFRGWLKSKLVPPSTGHADQLLQTGSLGSDEDRIEN